MLARVAERRACGRSGACATTPSPRVAAPLATSCGSSSPVSRNGPKWLVAICSSRPSAVRGATVPITPGVVDQHVDRRRTPRPRAAARRTDPRSARSTRAAPARRPAPRRGWRRAVSSSLAAVAPGEDDPGAAAGQLEGGVVAEAAEGRAGDQDRPAGLVGDVGQLPGVGRGARHGVVASCVEDLLRRAPGRPRRVTAPGSAAQRPPASRMNVSRSMRSVHRRLAPAAPASRSPRPRR